jgi:hypothetical protein
MALLPHRIEPATVLVDIKAWPGNVSVFGKVGATASLDIHCGRRRLSRAGRGEETGSAAPAGGPFYSLRNWRLSRTA